MGNYQKHSLQPIIALNHWHQLKVHIPHACERNCRSMQPARNCGTRSTHNKQCKKQTTAYTKSTWHTHAHACMRRAWSACAQTPNIFCHLCLKRLPCTAWQHVTHTRAHTACTDADETRTRTRHPLELVLQGLQVHGRHAGARAASDGGLALHAHHRRAQPWAHNTTQPLCFLGAHPMHSLTL